MLRQVVRVKDFRSFSGFKWDKSVEDFARVNVIYGWNGSGKSTFSDLLKRLGEGDSSFAEVKLDPEKDLEGTIRVFNQDFVRQAVDYDSDGVDQVVTFRNDKKLADERERLRARLDELRALINDASELESTIDAECKAVAKRVKEEHGRGYQPKTVRKILMTEPGAEGQEIGLDTLESAASGAEIPPAPRVLEWPDEALEGAIDSVRALVPKLSVDHHEIAEELLEWIAQGLPLHSSDHDCKFCGNQVSEERLVELRSRVAAYSEGVQGRASQLVADLEDARKRLEIPNDTPSELSAQLSAARTAKDKVSEAISSLNDAIEKRNREDCITRADALTELSASFRRAIHEYHEAADIYDQRSISKSRATKLLRERRLRRYDRSFEPLRQRLQTLEAQKEEQHSLEEDLRRVESQLADGTPQVEKLNNDLGGYLGRSELQFENENGRYILRRNGKPAEHLSEGERTAIAFLYFLRTLSDERAMPSIVVIDDPISSLDANRLHGAFGFMVANLMQDGRLRFDQVFLLTHNQDFFRRIKKWVGHLNRRKKPPRGRFYLMRAAPTAAGGRQSEITNLDKRLKQHDSEYQYLFSCVLEAAATPPATFSQRDTLANVGRRLLETFIAFRAPGSDSVHAALSTLSEDTGRNATLLNFFNAHSHANRVDCLTTGPETTSEGENIAGLLLEFIAEVDDLHYQRMVALSI